jgi:hypothetical protein
MGEIDAKTLFLETFAALITAAFGLIAALAWNEAIKALIAHFFQAGDALTGLFVYAIIVTVMAVSVTYIIAKSLARYGMELAKK